MRLVPVKVVFAITCAQVCAQDQDQPTLHALGELTPTVTASEVIISVPALTDYDRLLIVAGGKPIGWFWADAAGRFRRLRIDDAPVPAAVHGWGVPADLLGCVRPHLPEAVSIHAALESAGPGGERGWLRVGQLAGVRRGDWWWLRIGGQPAARFEVVHVTSGLSFGRITRLADFDLKPGVTFESWGPREGGLRSGVCLVDAESQRVWIALPGEFEAHGQPVHFQRDGHIVGRGNLERTADPFGHVLLSAATKLDAVHVGDDAVVFAPGTTMPLQGRVFVQDGVPCVDVGQVDGLELGREGRWQRGAEALGKARVIRLQTSYCVIEPVAGNAERLREGDQIVFEAAVEPAPIATLGSIVDATIFVAERELSAAGTLAAGTPVVIRDAKGVVGAALIAGVDGGQIIGFGLDATLHRSPRAGDRVTRD